MSQDFYFENNCIVLTESFLKRRGFCCKNSCRHCLWKNMKTRYILKTSNDLQFDFVSGEVLSIVDGDYDGWHGSYSIKIKVEDLKTSIPFWIDIDNKPYLICEVIKINEVE